jgi:hypothetical protein
MMKKVKGSSKLQYTYRARETEEGGTITNQMALRKF